MFDKAALFVYFGIFFALIAAGLGFPIPEELPIVTAGALVGHAGDGPDPDERVLRAVATLRGDPTAQFPVDLDWTAAYLATQIDQLPAPSTRVTLRWWIMLPVCILGVVISDGLLYGMGRFWGPRLLETRWIRKLVTPEKRQGIEENFHKYGVLVLLFARFLPTIRGPIFIMAGTMRLSLTRFILADGLYALPGVSLLFFLAYWFGDQFRELIEKAENKVGTARPILILLALAGVTAYLVYHFLRHPVATGDPRQELPVIGGQVADKIHTPEAHPAGADTTGIKGATAPG